MISNSLCVANSTFFSGLSTQTTSGFGLMAVRNTTMIGHNGFYSNSSAEVTVSDSIAMRNAPAGEDAALGSNSTNMIRSYLLHSSGTALTNEGPLEEAPIFRGAPDYREAADSPSIDFGSATAEPGELDLDGNLRKIGAKTDIGAYEFVPDAPSVSAVSTTWTSPTSATVNAAIDPNSGQSYYHVEYGPTVAYGTSTPTLILPAATSPANVQVDLTGLPANSTVHYRVVATSDGGTTASPDATLDTTPPAVPKDLSATPPAMKLPPPAKLAPKLALEGGTGGKPAGQPLLDRSTIKFSTACGPVACSVTVVGKVKVGAANFGTLPGPSKPAHWQAGKQGATKLRISSKLQKRVREYLAANPGAQAKIYVTATYVTADGSSATRKLTIPVRPV